MKNSKQYECRRISDFKHNLADPLIFSGRRNSHDKQHKTYQHGHLQFTKRTDRQLPSECTPENRKHCIKQQFHSNRLTDQPDTGIARQICGFIPSPVLPVHNTSSISSSFCLQLSPPKSASVCPSSTRKSSGVSSSLCTGCSQRYCCSYLCRSKPAVSF